jgi:diguanylate cyclase (GGDEF)-like protein
MDGWNLPNRSTILLIAGDSAIRAALREERLAARYRVVEAASADEGVGVFRQSPPDLVLLDVSDSSRQLLELCKTLRKEEAGGQVPIVILAGEDDLDAIRMGHESAVTDFIAKPVSERILGHRLEYILAASADRRGLARSLDLMAEAQDFAGLGTWEWSLTTRTLELSDAAQRILGITQSGAMDTVDTLLRNVPEGDRPRVRAWLEDASLGGLESTIEHRVTMPDGTERIVRQRALATAAAPGVPRRVSVVISDISEWRKVEAQNRYQTHHDLVTGLENLNRFVQRLEEAIWVVQRSGDRFAILCLGVEKFGRIHESMGHRYGDGVLKGIAERLQNGVRKTDWYCRVTEEVRIPRLARLDGAHFAILLQPINRVEDIARVASRINHSFSQPIVFGDQEQFLSTHIGIAIYPDDGRDAEELLRRAQTAMHCAQEEGRAEPYFSTSQMTEEATERLALEASLRRALERDQLEAYYQPKVELTTGRVAGFEALLRWQHPELGFVPPAKFIPVAEETGVIVPIGEWILHTACLQAIRWRDAGHGPLPMAVNVSAEQLRRSNIVDVVSRTLEGTGLPPELLEIEITESALMDDTEANLVILNELKQLGVLLSLDDFGTGYSSLSYLRRFPIDVLKIDRSFVTDVARDSEADAIVTTIVHMARGLDLKVIAEGVETEAQLAFLRGLGCDAYQGYLFSKPRPAESATALLEQQSGHVGNAGAVLPTAAPDYPTSDQ